MLMLLCAVALITGLGGAACEFEPADVVAYEANYNEQGECYWFNSYDFVIEPNVVQKIGVSNGNAATKWHMRYVFNKAGQLVRTENGKDGNTVLEREYSYDERGNLLAYKNYSGDKAGGEYTYDDDNNRLSYRQIWADGTVGDVFYYGYDEQGRRVSEKSFNGRGELNSSVVYKYDGDLLVRREQYALAGALVSRQEYKYDVAGRLMSVETYDIYDGLLRWQTFTYDENGNKLSETENTPGGMVADKRREYDEQGRCVGMYNYYADGWYERIRYEYDESGNVIAQYSQYGDEAETHIEYKYKTVLLPRNLQQRYEISDNEWFELEF